MSTTLLSKRTNVFLRGPLGQHNQPYKVNCSIMHATMSILNDTATTITQVLVHNSFSILQSASEPSQYFIFYEYSNTKGEEGWWLGTLSRDELISNEFNEWTNTRRCTWNNQDVDEAQFTLIFDRPLQEYLR